jgi:transcriptional regulator with GAF, ATPase, and Fis domain
MQSFRSLNLSQFPESLLESELFGHRKGAFTGAVESHEGALARCSPHGAVFLDEIGDASVPVQIKLLRVLQERAFSPVGSHEEKRFHGRVIAATNKPLVALRGDGLFRDDFFYRLSSDIVEMPTLRQRIRETPDELDALLRVVMARLVGAEAPELAALVRAVIVHDLEPDYPWPGNVRELEQCARRALLTRAYTGDRRADTPGRLDRLVAALDAGACDMRQLTASYCALLYERHGTYEDVSRRTGLDRRTAKKYVLLGG